MRWESIGGREELGRWERDGLCIGGRGVADLTARVILIGRGGARSQKHALARVSCTCRWASA